MPTTTTKYYYYTKQNVADIHLLLYRDADEYSLGETVPGGEEIPRLSTTVAAAGPRPACSAVPKQK
jgi:hypothetical protein